MKLSQLYDSVIKAAIEKDLRGKNFVERELLRRKQKFNTLSDKEKKGFDTETLINPYSDTRILFGDRSLDVKKILVGIDIESAEIILADNIRNKDGLDLVISHHPEGKALAGLSEVMQLQIDILAGLGIPINVAESLTSSRIDEVARKLHSGNHNRAVDTARLLNMPFMCAHTASDNFVANFLQDIFDKKKPYELKDVIDILEDIPEYEIALQGKSGPKVLLGKETNRAGKIFVDMTGGTEGSKDLFNYLIRAGVNTIISMHLSEEHFKKASLEHLNIIIAGHIASDTLGLNLLFDSLGKKEKFEIINCSGFTRITR
ncbi:MAG: NGG1p interacting factor NIF3 [Candidatus Omnitrophota bacterium]